MGRFIVKQEDFYFEWSAIVDAPVTFGMKLDEFREYYKERYGTEGMEGLQERLDRVGKNGTSSFMSDSAEDEMEANRAGPDECELSCSEIFQAYCLRQPIRDGWMVP